MAGFLRQLEDRVQGILRAVWRVPGAARKGVCCHGALIEDTFFNIYTLAKQVVCGAVSVVEAVKQSLVARSMRVRRCHDVALCSTGIRHRDQIDIMF